MVKVELNFMYFLKHERSAAYFLEIIHLILTQDFPKNKHFLLPDTHTYVCTLGGNKFQFFGKLFDRNE